MVIFLPIAFVVPHSGHITFQPLATFFAVILPIGSIHFSFFHFSRSIFTPIESSFFQ